MEEVIEELRAIRLQNSKLLEAQQSDKWLTDVEVAERFQTSKDTIRRWRDTHGLPFSQIGEVRRYSMKKIDAWFAKFSPQAILNRN